MALVQLPSGVRLYVDDRGRGDPPLVFVHAWSMNHRLWENQVAAFMRSHRVVSYDQRGHGASDKPDGDYTMQTYARDLYELLVALDLRGVVLVGWSMGSWVVVRYMHAYEGARVRKLALVGASPVLLARPDCEHALPPQVMAELGAQLGQDRAQATEAFYARTLHAGASRQMLGWIVRTSLETPLPIAMASFENIAADDLRPALSGVRVPTAVFHGREDLVPLAAAQATRDLIPDAELVVFDGSGHFPHLEEPQAFNEALARFVR